MAEIEKCEKEACRQEYDLSEIVRKYLKIKDKEYFMYELDRLGLEVNEKIELMEFLHCLNLMGGKK